MYSSSFALTGLNGLIGLKKKFAPHVFFNDEVRVKCHKIGLHYSRYLLSITIQKRLRRASKTTVGVAC